MRLRVWRRGLAVVVLLGCALGKAHAQEATHETSESERLAWANYDPRREGSGVLALSGELGVADPQRATGDTRTLSGGFGLSILGRRKTWPVLVGLAIGVSWFGSSTQLGPTLGLNRPEGGFYFGDTFVARSLELRHAELLLRVQPWWSRFRPYIEGAAGVVGLWSSTSLLDTSGATLRRAESQRSVSFIAGASVGLDASLLALAEDEVSRTTLVLSAGVRRLYTGELGLPLFEAEGEGATRLSSVRERMRMWQPFLALSIGIETKTRPKEREHP